MENTDIIKFRLGRADETYEEARLLFENGYYHAAANRLYYAAFYAVNALLIATDIIAKTHSGVKNCFFRDFIATTVFRKEVSGLYQRLFDLRSQSDYEDLAEVGKDEVEPFVVQTGNFIEELKNYIKAHFLK